ncbi:hypothetical protein BKA66DRAFT_515011 [Pyrenochaeta sp. MPI-SDFR-AT-0127]|nr:hypothetical protein BKA66DRAFT_515011 [Pyrenochaeta sp. MPI-SDFR-AT-0127]
MTATNTLVGTVNEDDHSITDNDAASLLHVEPAISNADLYALTPPAYTQSIAEGEISVDAEATRDGKTEANERSLEQNAPSHYPLQRDISNASSSREVAQPADPRVKVEEQVIPPLIPSTPSITAPILGHFLTEPVTVANLVGVRACSVLPDRPAIWLVKRKKSALSPFAAAVLIKEGLLRTKDLELISQYSGTRRDPTDPVSGILFGVYDTVEEMMLGLVAGPVELGKQANPMLVRYKSSQTANGTASTESTAVVNVKNVPQVAAQVAIGTGKGLGRIVTASLKSPMLIMNGVTRGFHNLPKTYGEEVREYKNVTGFRSGLCVGAQSFGYGLADGLKDLVAKPLDGAAQSGCIGFGDGLAKGIGNALFKPAAGACGLLGYPSVGIYKSIRNMNQPQREDPADLVRKLGDVEYQYANDADKLYVVRVWCQTQMRVQLT